ncbi:DUF3322 and DUF2220 domain-containing protein [Cellulomonas phragmiteti]|uniref:DUF3322 and DUF2220 domain-containing protein n=1 Tax=Cellulomonas phragmiteti TaxID=478780 RepID=UPI001EF35C29|nr:DUF3322 and DUF2220 domain-containing protein [Cellulomonas phragmiteti]
MTTRTRPAAVDLGAWQTWADAWSEVEDRIPAGCTLERGAAFDPRAPHALHVEGLDAAVSLVEAVEPQLGARIGRLRRTAHTLLQHGARVEPAVLVRVARLDDADVEVLCAALDWLGDHPDDIARLTERQLPVPGMDTKWLPRHGTLLRDLAGWDVRAHLRRRSAVAHLTYVDPEYRATGARRHDAWTSGDSHRLAYRPRTVLVVENRDCRLDFPDLPGTIVVEGSGKAATWLLADVPWVRSAERVVYWGDLDADGFEILDRFRTALATPSDEGGAACTVTSILMDADTIHRYGDLGVVRDRRGRRIERTAVDLTSLTEVERTAYYAVTTRGAAPVRRIEQERLPLVVAAELVAALTEAPSQGSHFM